MKLLDLFCGAGGAAKGYQRAGFYVIGIDINPQPHYCGDEFVRADALEYLAEHGREFDVVHASPPCQAYTAINVVVKGNPDYSDLIDPTRELLRKAGIPYIIENVEGAPLVNPIMLCGTMFGLKIRRHRLFECSVSLLLSPATCCHLLRAPRSGRAPKDGEFYSVVGHFSDVEGAREAMGINWMTRDELAQAIPPAYTEWLGRRLLEALRREAAA